MYDADEPTDPDNYYNCADSDPDISTPGTGTINAAMCYIDIGATGADYQTKSQHTFTITPRDNIISNRILNYYYKYYQCE